MEAGVEIVETLTFRRANRAQVKASEEDVFLSGLCISVHAVIMFTNASVHGWVRVSGRTGSYIAPE